MKQRRQQSVIILTVLGILLVIAASIALPSWQQNRQVRSYFDSVFTALKEKDRDTISAIYGSQTLEPAYTELIFKYSLLGWDIDKVEGQPWPTELGTGSNYITVTLYYDLPKEMLRPKGKFQEIQDPAYGHCARIRQRIAFTNMPNEGVKIGVPDYDCGANWLAPFCGSLSRMRERY